MPGVLVHLLSRFEVQRNGQAIPGLEARKVQELFCYLLLFRAKPHSRELLASCLWGDNSTSQSKKYLRQALWQLQSALDFDQNESILLLEREWVQLNPSVYLWLDTAEFERSIQDIQGIPGRELNDDQAKSLVVAVQLYKGDLLEGCFQDWCIFERERLQQLYLQGLDKLMSYCEANGAYEQGLQYGSCILRVDHARERTHRRLMRLYALSGDRTSALRQYRQLCATLREELGVKPAKQSVALHRQIEDDHLSRLKSNQDGHQEIDATRPALNILNNLKRLQKSLIDFQHEIQDNINSIEQTSDDDR